MALVKCPYCGGAVSTSAIQCPHCGQPLQQQAVAPMPQPAPQPAPQQPYELTLPKLGSILMMVIGFVAIVLLAVERAHWDDNELSMDFHKAVAGYMYSFAALYFLIQIFMNKANQFVATMAFALAMFLNITQQLNWTGNYAENTTMEWINEHYDYFSIAFGFAMIWYAGSMKNWSKYVMLAAGSVWIATVSFRQHNGQWLSELLADHTLIILGIAMGVAMIGMLINWMMESSNANNHPLVRLLAGAEGLLILATIIIVAISAKDVLDANYEDGMGHAKLSMIFLMLTGATSLFFAITFTQDKVMYFMSAVFMAIAMFLILGYYIDFLVNTHSYWDEAYFKHLTTQIRDLYYSARFLLPIAVMATYMAEATKGITDKMTLKVQ